MATTRSRRRILARRSAVYRALLDAADIPRWRVPPGMTCVVHDWDAREGGAFRVSLTYDAPDRAGKTTAHTDTYRGRFVTLVENEEIVEVLEFETADPAMRGEMTIRTSLLDVVGGTELVATHEGLPAGVKPEDNELGWSQSLERLAALVEGRFSWSCG